jgi:hypothetical protein
MTAVEKLFLFREAIEITAQNKSKKKDSKLLLGSQSVKVIFSSAESY